MNTPIAEINAALRADPAEFVRQADENYAEQLRRIAEDIRDHREQRPVILLSGPSGSGKTTTALMLENYLDSWGFETHTLSMDNYFIPLSKEELALAAQDKMDLESPDRVDIPFLNEQLTRIINCQPVDIPKFNFKENKRLSSGWTLQRKPGELVILEGIHALNPAVITIPDEQTTRIYVSVRTRLTAGDRTLHPKKIRLLRRMLRDELFRSRPAEETRLMFPSVQRGENRYIMPYKERSIYDVDTFIPYEVSIYKTFLLEELKKLPPHPDTDDLVSVLEPLEGLDPQLVPPTSLIREFIGGGQFQY